MRKTRFLGSASQTAIVISAPGNLASKERLAMRGMSVEIQPASPRPLSISTEAKEKAMTEAVAKKKPPHPNTVPAGDVTAHLKIAKEMIEQAMAGHYSFENLHILQADNPDGTTHMNFSFDRRETNPSAPHAGTITGRD